MPLKPYESYNLRRFRIRSHGLRSDTTDMLGASNALQRFETSYPLSSQTLSVLGSDPFPIPLDEYPPPSPRDLTFNPGTCDFAFAILHSFYRL